MYPSVPPTATRKPMAAEVPMALRMGTLHQSRNGMTMVPPPMDTSVLNHPVKTPVALIPAKPGN